MTNAEVPESIDSTNKEDVELGYFCTLYQQDFVNIVSRFYEILTEEYKGLRIVKGPDLEARLNQWGNLYRQFRQTASMSKPQTTAVEKQADVPPVREAVSVSASQKDDEVGAAAAAPLPLSDESSDSEDASSDSTMSGEYEL